MKGKNIIFGSVVILIGILLGLNFLGVTNIEIFFDGWWTLFIIVPCLIGLVTEEDKLGNGFCLIIGVLLLLMCRDILTFRNVGEITLVVGLIALGIKLVMRGIFTAKKPNTKGTNKNHSAIFSGQTLNYANENFQGANFIAIFGSVDCDLREAVIEQDVLINANCIFGGVDILVPPNVKVKQSSVAVFGGIENKVKNPIGDAPTIYISGICAFGGIEIK